MTDSLRDQLRALGFKPAPREKPKPAPPAPARPPGPNSAGHRPARDAEPDLARAYAARAREELEERARAQREAEAKAREKKERRERLSRLLDGRALNDPNADVARHFTSGTKIRRVYVTRAQLDRLNAGELGVVQLAGRFLLVERAIAQEAGAISADALALLPEPGSAAEDDVPPDLVW